MDQYSCISTAQALELLKKDATVADIRDQQSFVAGHMPHAVNVNNDNLHQFMQDADMDKPLLVCCYHGISSQSAAQFLVQQGFDEVYSVNGGFEAWRVDFPDQCEK
ncbi:thiosulfate sulfurtransferase GlpE [Pontibacterium sp. N1Y112]|uniref:Thiosulfate sulfurtransferase GlpE n=1 Tax=Pontibacterium sinense TaxID=2781979 RepID=A0A8J7F7C2_9GAMM|nr:thiosulfate sulfurtransferase GlpE [Pontibacterium sinense]MBE9396445.1 thiosulfate sulfurtransferase GlpE [Pontibacterium sinense]